MYDVIAAELNQVFREKLPRSQETNSTKWDVKKLTSLAAQDANFRHDLRHARMISLISSWPGNVA